MSTIFLFIFNLETEKNNPIINLRNQLQIKINVVFPLRRHQSITLSFILTTPYSSGSGIHLATHTRVEVVKIGPPLEEGVGTRVVYMLHTKRI